MASNEPDGNWTDSHQEDAFKFKVLASIANMTEKSGYLNVLQNPFAIRNHLQIVKIMENNGWFILTCYEKQIILEHFGEGGIEKQGRVVHESDLLDSTFSSSGITPSNISLHTINSSYFSHESIDFELENPIINMQISIQELVLSKTTRKCESTFFEDLSEIIGSYGETLKNEKESEYELNEVGYKLVKAHFPDSSMFPDLPDKKPDYQG
ncbi:unnamed protein product [Caenorhabditis angaria]|uniref:Uncharacterized protein n=1 Tax=Caenorhabditis angaria TaxID=860376 RepID=A0A9P1I5B1_9PELO|nr:unnamed protein product [Caenorhabditis angaria]